jgi:hypothetical protein
VTTKSKKPSRKAKPGKAELLPTKVALDELKTFQTTFRKVFQTYRREIESGLTQVVGSVAKAATSKSRSKDSARDLSEMLVLLRGLNVKPAKGRRRDLKRIESTVEDLREIVARW